MRKKTRSLLLVATLALGACSEQAAPPPPPDVDPRAAVLDAIAAAYEAGTMHQDFRMMISAGEESFTFTGEGDVDNERQRARMSMDLGMLGGTMDMIMVDGVVYMRSPVFSQQAGTAWISMDPSKLDPATAAQFGGFGTGTTDPSAYVGLFAGVIDVTADGRDQVAGTPTTRYTGTIDLGKVMERLPEVVGSDLDRASKDQLRQALDQFEALGIEGMVPFEIWIDDEGFPRRETITMDFASLAPGAGGTMEMAVEFSSFGEPVRVVPPPAGKVTDLTKLIAQGSGG